MKTFLIINLILSSFSALVKCALLMKDSYPRVLYFKAWEDVLGLMLSLVWISWIVWMLAKP